MALNWTLVAAEALGACEKFEAQELVKACEAFDCVELKFNWDPSPRAGELGEFCARCEGKMVGYMQLDGRTGMLEATAAVLPDFRRQGIFRGLFEAARAEARRVEAKELLLVGYRRSAPGCAAIARLNVPYRFSEYCMRAEAATIPAAPQTDIRLEEATPETVEIFANAVYETFGNRTWSAPGPLLEEMQRPETRFYLAWRGETLTGEIGVITGAFEVYIRSFGILPQWRRRGYGRQLLSLTVHCMLAEGHQTFELDVATDNANALALYRACGFQETNIYDYFVVPLE